MKGNFKRALLIPAITLLSFSLVLPLSGCSSSGSTPAAAPAPRQRDVKNVKPVAAAMSPIIVSVEYPSKLKALQEVNISSEISGRIATLSKDVGSSVQQGEVIFTLEATDLKSTTRQQILTAEQTVDKAQVSYNDNKSSYDRNEALYQTGAISKQALTDAEVKLKNSEIELKTARENLNAIRQRLLQSSDSAPDTTVIRAPISGTVSIRNVSQGEMVSTSTKAFTIIDTSYMLAEVGVPDKMVGKLRKGQNITLKINTQGNKELEGIVDSISPSTDATTQTYIVKIKVSNSDGSLKPGMFARAILPVDSREKVLTVPNESIKIENGIRYVYVVDNGSIRKRAIEVGLSNEKISEITKNLKEGELVLTEGQIFLSDGEKVNIVDEKGESKPAGSGTGGGNNQQGGSRPAGTGGNKPAASTK